ncbi:cysteine peptidase family C39 domain-containing protein [Methylobacter svalbardensis]|uniref:cysteine peptidase family C39 domain-containing protein n=1 Tax=Methylobacter svalbardensis TaxID=3080016 RepID=UPI0030EC9A64
MSHSTNSRRNQQTFISAWEPTASAADSIRQAGLPEPLIAIGATPTELDNQALAPALKRFADRADHDDIRPLNDFLQSHPRSPWRIALLTNLGLIHYHAARFSLATEASDAAWQTGRTINADGAAKAVIDRALGELIRMHARLGHQAELWQLLAEIQDRPLSGAATEMVAGAKEGLWIMENQPGVAYLCGPKALQSIIDRFQPAGSQRSVIENACSGSQGYSLNQVAELAEKAHVPQQMVKRTPGAEWVFPAVVHWKSSHYAALLEQRDGRIHIKDPTFGGDLWVSPASLEQEASGYLLIPPGPLPKGYHSMFKFLSLEIQPENG